MHTPFERTVQPVARPTERRFGAMGLMCCLILTAVMLAVWSMLSAHERS